MQRLSHEVGLGFDVSEKLGADWMALCEAWIEAESALMTAGGPPLALENRGVPVPPSLIRWSHTRVAKNYEDIDYPTIGIEVAEWWGRIRPEGNERDADILVKKEWCGGGLTGIVLLVMGMKVWGLSLKEEERAAWSQMVREVADVFKLIPSAQVL